MKILRFLFILLSLQILPKSFAFWDMGTTTLKAFAISGDTVPRQSFFRWQRTESRRLAWWYPHFDWEELEYRRKLSVFAGLSIDQIPLGTAVLLNRRVLITSANFLEPYLTRQRDVRIWALGRAGLHITPYRYRVWRFRRLIPRSDNPEHWHGPRGVHVVRHDISVVHSMDQMYIYYKLSTTYQYPYKAFLCSKHYILNDILWFGGSGFETLNHIAENYKILNSRSSKDDIVDCSKYLPKWWGKFICIKNTKGLAGIQNGGGLFSHPDDYLVGLGCFEIRYNEDRIMVFTDLRYYVDLINTFANISRGEYYEYAYPEWSIVLGWIYDSMSNHPYIPHWQVKDDIFPLGRR